MKQIAGKEGRRGPEEGFSKPAFPGQQKAWVFSVPSRGRLGLGVKEVESMGGRQKLAGEHLHPRGQPEGDSRNASRCSSTWGSGFSFHKIFKGSQIHESGVLVLVLEFV